MIGIPISDWFVLLFYVVIIYMLVKPDSPASTWIQQMGEALTALTKLAVSG